MTAKITKLLSSSSVPPQGEAPSVNAFELGQAARRTRRRYRGVAGLAGILTLLLGGLATAQDPEPNQKEPNIMLVIDSSGSMEYRMTPDTNGDVVYPECYADGSDVSERSRWIDLVEVLTGTIDNYRCESVDRKMTPFITEYEVGQSVPPPDANYVHPYHRPMSGTCTVVPDNGALTANAFAWVPPAFREYDSTLSCSSFTQQPNGLIDSLDTDVRFGLMTFDTLPDSGTGYANTSDQDYSSGSEGSWSYFVGSAATGRPQGCKTPQPMEVGVRNGAAPAWEGRMINFGNPDASTTQGQKRHREIEDVLLATRPYGATPIAGALEDAYDFFIEDTTGDTLDGSDYHYSQWGPTTDPYVLEGCREQYVILLTDGEPNQDMRPHCEGNGACPYLTAPDEAAKLFGVSSHGPIPTYVVGFAPETTDSGTNCSTMTSADWAPGGLCTTLPDDRQVQACCALNEIADAGGTGSAYFATDKDDLRDDLAKIFNQIVAGSASATRPVRSPGIGSSDSTGTRAYRLLTSYTKPAGAGLWRGNVERLRWVCDANGVATEADKDENEGDDFSRNVSDNPDDRRFVTFQAADVSGDRFSDYSLRPNLSSGTVDGIGSYSGEMVEGDRAGFISALNADTLRKDNVSGPCDALTPDACKAMIFPWLFGVDNGAGGNRCVTPGDPACSAIGDVQHSTPVIVNRPMADVDDATYEDFAGAQSQRPMMAYMSSNDGLFHGFVMAPNGGSEPIVNTNDNNEQFAFLPPAVLPVLQSQYPSNRQKLLDGVPVVQDVIASPDATNTYYPFKLERDNTALTGGTATWRTVMIQSFGGSNAGYYALDVTEPTESATVSTNRGPRLLWQLTRDNTGNFLFGEKAATPIITTLNIGGTETAVAVLPGGYGSTVTGDCARRGGAVYPDIPTAFVPRPRVRCYALDRTNNGVTGDDTLTNVGARSLTIVRLDTGEVIRSFRADPLEIPALTAAFSGASQYNDPTTGLIIQADLDSPISGTPAAYPAGPGTLADRIFVGDQDGGLWRVDVSDANPSNWTMNLFFDTFNAHPDVANPALAALAGRAIALPPTLSVDRDGNITVALGSGDQDLSGTAGEEHYVWSLTERTRADNSGFRTAVNWYHELENGEHVLGDIQLVSGILYFSTYQTDPSASACIRGESQVYGMHYVNPADASAPENGGAPGLEIAGGTGAVAVASATDLGMPAGTLIFGVAIEFTPSCTVEAAEVDTLFGTTHNSIQSTTTSKMQLVFQTGNVQTSKSGLGFQTDFEAVDLEAPKTVSTIESWAAILD